MTCTTCHNPHDVARGQAAAVRYNAVCRACHATAHSAGVPARGDCVQCHMPRRRTEDAVHVTMTDHYIQHRRPAGDLLTLRTEIADAGYRGEVVAYYPEASAGELYVAIAQVRDGSNLESGIPRLRQAIERIKPAQPQFYLELAKAYSRTGDPGEAVRWCEQALRIRPGFGPAQRNLVRP